MNVGSTNGSIDGGRVPGASTKAMIGPLCGGKGRKKNTSNNIQELPFLSTGGEV